MSSAIQTAVNGITQAVSQATQSAAGIVNASSTGKNIDGDLINLKIDSTQVSANAAVIRTSEKTQKALLDIVV